MAIIEPFDRHYTEYENWFEDNSLTYQSELAALKGFIPHYKMGIEIGIGSGRFGAPLGIEVGIDPSPRMREIAKSRGLEVCGAVAEALPFSDGVFGFALMVTTICFLDDVEAALKEACRVIEPAGSVIIGFIDKDSPLGKLYQQRREESVFYDVATFYSVSDIVSQLRKAGFKAFNFVQTIFHNLAEISDIEPTKEGYGEGSFVVVRATKQKLAEYRPVQNKPFFANRTGECSQTQSHQ
ncbi:MAG: methyltransferase domain-containing protein [Dehalococcoidia bacterium]